MSESCLLSGESQLQLQLFPEEPWGGVSPRALTRGYSLHILRADPPLREVFFDPEQLELFGREGERRRKGPFVYEGAPLL